MSADFSNEILENNKRFLARKGLFKKFGYDIDKDREFILDHSGPIQGRILEAGTGKGHFAIALAKRGYKFTTFDISQEEQRIARMNLAYAALEKAVEFKVENGEHTTFPSGSFDVIFSVNVIHHLDNPYKVVDEMIRILSPNGKIILVDFTAKGFEIIDKIHALEGGKHGTGKAPLSDIRAYAEKKNFSVKEIRGEHQQIMIITRKG